VVQVLFYWEVEALLTWVRRAVAEAEALISSVARMVRRRMASPGESGVVYLVSQDAFAEAAEMAQSYSFLPAFAVIEVKWVSGSLF
jgi:hypothetical protein